MGKQRKPQCKPWLSISAIVLFFLSLSVLSARADTVVLELYEAILPSQSQSQQEWQQSVQQGLGLVLERISHSPTVQENAFAKQAIQNAPDFVEQYTYEGDSLHIKYSPELINQLVQKMGYKDLGQQSFAPKVILWLAIEDNHQRRLVGQETDPSLQTYLQHIAKRKDIPLILPLMDLEDMSAITVTDVWGQFPSILQKASSRYGANIILLGRLLHNTTQWEGNWQILGQDLPPLKIQGENLEAVLDQGFSGIIAYLKNHMNQRSFQVKDLPNGRPFLIGIRGVHTSADFNNVENYLKSFNQVAEVNIYQLLSTMAIFEITPRGDSREALEHALGTDQRLIPAFSSEQEMTNIGSTYHWVKVLP